MYRRILVLLLISLAAVTPVFSAGSQESGGDQARSVANEPYNPLTPYDPPITITRAFRDDNRTYPPGQTWDDNVWTRSWAEELGINFEYVWSVPGSEYNAKLNVAIASGDLPDLIEAPYDIFYRLASSGALEDLTAAYDNAQDPEFKELYESDGGLGLELSSVGGKLYGLGGTVAPNQIPVLAYRTDWAERLGIDPPEDIQDVIDMMRAFASEDPNGDGTETYGLALAQDLWSTTNKLDAFFAAFNSYPRLWVEKNGRIEWGGVQPEARQVLSTLRDLYEEGVIHEEFALKSPWVELGDDLVNNEVGLTFGVYWWTDWKGAAIAENTGGEGVWTMMEVPDANGGPARVPAQQYQRKTLAVRRGFEFPEAVVKLIDHQLSRIYIPERMDSDLNFMEGPDGESIRTIFYCFIDIDGGLGEVDQARRIMDAMERRDPSTLPAAEIDIYNKAMAYEVNGQLDMYGIWGKYGPESGSAVTLDVINNDRYQSSAFLGPNTETMNRSWGNLTSKMNETYTRIIMGAPIEEFDQWVEYWNDQGGSEITAEVNEWYANR